MAGPNRNVTVITGGSRGIGAATAERLAAEGHDLVLAYVRHGEAAHELVTRLASLGARCHAVSADISKHEDIVGLFAEAVDTFGAVTGLVNNAGATASVGPLADTPVDVIRKVVDVNLMGAVLCCREAARLMSPRHGGCGGAIVNISSVAASTGAPHEYIHYAAAKAGVEALTIGLAKELAEDDIRVNAVAPGTVATDIHADAGDPGRPERVAHRIPMRRVGRPKEIAEAVTWLLGPGASYTTGAVLRVAGGL
jgi:NAD(P)-dependent dehydrogenase (short-subunit alcohol dehydrogenase family)